MAEIKDAVNNEMKTRIEAATVTFKDIVQSPSAIIMEGKIAGLSRQGKVKIDEQMTNPSPDPNPEPDPDPDPNPEPDPEPDPDPELDPDPTPDLLILTTRRSGCTTSSWGGWRLSKRATGTRVYRGAS